MKGKQKLYFLLDAIDDAREIAPSGQPVLINHQTNLNGRYSGMELIQLFTKLEKDEQVLRDLDPNNNLSDGYYHLEIFPAFDKYFLKIQQEPEYQEFTGKKPINLPEQTHELEEITEIVYEITYTKSREVLLNKLLLISKPDFNSENDLFFSFLYENPNKTFKISEIEAKIGTLTKDIHKILENLGFTGDIRKVFINASKTSICFSNPITRSDLEKLGINIIKLPK